MPPERHPGRGPDLILVGGGLANGLIAWRLKTLRPELRLLVLEQDDVLGGNHTWSFHPSDLTPAQRAWIDPLVCHRWSSHEVVFPQRSRRLEGGYASIESRRFAEVVGAALGGCVRTGVRVRRVAPTQVELDDGTVLDATAVIDGRGVRASAHLQLGFQKFLGLEVRLAAPHGLTAPLLMDASVAQHDGYRFVYLLPFTSDTLLIEDTCYADGAALDAQQLRERIADYAHQRGWTIEAVLREETGVLPILLRVDPQAYWAEAAGVPRAGLAAGLFHPTTGYSLPDAVVLADHIAALRDLSAPALFASVRSHAILRWRERGFFMLLNRMLFRAAEPDARWKVMQRFYGLSEGLIARFYAARLTWADKLRILTGKPPVPFMAGVRAALGLPVPAAKARAQ